MKLNPKNSEAWAGLGNLAWTRGRVDEAIADYEKALAARPGNYEAAMNLATAYDKTGQAQRGDAIRQQAAALRH
ncbi:MAG: tetratricopeptide repeat protein [Nitrosomonadales bacterium]|nr:tetratricopeptide repeat protein [Nitrosomonadales bacterium]